MIKSLGLACTRVHPRRSLGVIWQRGDRSPIDPKWTRDAIAMSSIASPGG